MSNIVYSLNEINSVASKILHERDIHLICLHGELGAGKTTLIKALLKKLGAEDAGSSPTFALANEYLDANGGILAYHLDCYRIGNPEEALDFGIEEYLEADCWVFVEWPEHIQSLLPEERTEIRIEHLDGDRRRLTIYP
jgi:tRNA threonylcarbamoyladenosine biosynthesis protein TsaE